MLTHNCRVLVVEDSPLIAMMMEAMLEDLGYWVIGPLHNLGDAVRHAIEDDIDFAVLDFDLGNGSNCVPIVRILAERHIPFLIASGETAATIHGRLPGAAILSKPVREVDLERLLHLRAFERNLNRRR